MAEQEMVNVYIQEQKHEVPAVLTIIGAVEYAGYELTRGCGCRSGFCGACATVYRIKGDKNLRVALACQKKVEEGMYLSQLPFFPGDRPEYDLEELEPSVDTFAELYPEIYKCLGCNSCTSACPQEIDVMQYIALAQRGEIEKCAEKSFDCIMCGLCASRCPADITHYNVGVLARRLTGKYLLPESGHLQKRLKELEEGEFTKELDELMELETEELKERYNSRKIK